MQAHPSSRPRRRLACLTYALLCCLYNCLGTIRDTAEEVRQREDEDEPVYSQHREQTWINFFGETTDEVSEESFAESDIDELRRRHAN